MTTDPTALFVAYVLGMLMLGLCAWGMAHDD
jgi:hypothetical protein